MDYEYMTCLKKTSTGADVIECMRNVHTNTDKLMKAITDHPSCANLDCFKKTRSQEGENYQDCLTADNIKIDKFTDYLKLINKKTSNLTIDYINCIHKSKSPKDYQKCLDTIAKLMDDFKSYLNAFCHQVTKQGNTRSTKQKQSQDVTNKADKADKAADALCQEYQQELINLLGECGYPSDQIKQHLQTSNNPEDCQKNIKDLTELVTTCLQYKDKNITNHIVSKLSSLNLDLETLLNETPTKGRKSRHARGKQRSNNKSCKAGSVCWKKKCQPWQKCWIKESGYDPTKDVHNIYYGFNTACQHALGPLEGCDPYAPVYSAPPPAGF